MFFRSLSLVSTRLYQILSWTVDTPMLSNCLFDPKESKLQNPLDSMRKLPSQVLSYLQPFNFPKKKG